MKSNRPGGALVGPITTGSSMAEIMSMFSSSWEKTDVTVLTEKLVEIISKLGVSERVEVLNQIRLELHEVSPFKEEPVDCVQWIPAEAVIANDYNPNAVAPPEMELLRHSIMEDGYTQPIVAWQHDDTTEVIDGFHRNRVGKECKDVYKRIHGYLPIAAIKPDREDRKDRIASTIRHNRARGKHKIDAMSDIVVELKRRNWTNKRICKELGMDEDEVLRLCQITGLSDLFSDRQFSEAWDVADSISDIDETVLSEELAQDEQFRKVPSNQNGRIFHEWQHWECYEAGFYATTVPGKSRQECEEEYAIFLSNEDKFRKAAFGVIRNWEKSCEHYLSNQQMNRIAWIGQAAAAYELNLPATYRGGFTLMTKEQQEAANKIALEALNQWLTENDRDPLTMEEAYTGRQVDLY